jgi:hypothetical protein
LLFAGPFLQLPKHRLVTTMQAVEVANRDCTAALATVQVV